MKQLKNILLVIMNVLLLAAVVAIIAADIAVFILILRINRIRACTPG